MDALTISDHEFARFQKLIHQIAGIAMADSKRTLLAGRLARRLRQLGLASYGEYFEHVRDAANAVELQTMVDLLTTNETYFFREPAHFDFLREVAGAHASPGRPFRVWSGASSSGEEAYSMAMVLADELGDRPWEVFGSDISLTVLERARAGIYPLARASGISPERLRRYCLRGTRSQEGMLQIAPELRARVRFAQVNLTQSIVRVGEFDLIFLRNVMIYFDAQTKRRVVANMLPALRPDGHFLVGHSETLNGVSEALRPVKPTIYRRRD